MRAAGMQSRNAQKMSLISIGDLENQRQKLIQAIERGSGAVADLYGNSEMTAKLKVGDFDFGYRNSIGKKMGISVSQARALKSGLENTLSLVRQIQEFRSEAQAISGGGRTRTQRNELERAVLKGLEQLPESSDFSQLRVWSSQLSSTGPDHRVPHYEIAAPINNLLSAIYSLRKETLVRGGNSFGEVLEAVFVGKVSDIGEATNREAFFANYEQERMTLERSLSEELELQGKVAEYCANVEMYEWVQKALEARREKISEIARSQKVTFDVNDPSSLSQLDPAPSVGDVMTLAS